MTATAPPPSIDLPATAAPVLRLRAHADDPPSPVALREKHLGVWQDITWREYWDQAVTVANALLSLGIEVGDRVAVHSENRFEWVATDFGTQAIRAACMGLYPTNPAAEVGYMLADAGARVLVAEDQEQVDKVLELDRADLPDLEVIVYLEERGVRDYDDDRLLSWVDFLERGRAHQQAHPHAVDERLAAITDDDLAVLIYTSGTTGPPKGAMITVGNINWAIATTTSPTGFFQPPIGPSDWLLSYLPLCHVYERLLTCWQGASQGATVHFAESIDTVTRDLTEVQPTIFATVPRILEKMHAGVSVRMASASRLKRANWQAWTSVARRIGATKVANDGNHTAGTRVMEAVGDVFLFRALKERLGLQHCRAAISGAAPIAPELLEFFMGIGVPISEAYGQTENCAVATANPLDDVALGTVGKPLEGIELRLDEQTNEILVRHPAVFAGYWNKPDETAETVDADGWLHTGDVGEWQGEHLRIVDRIKDIIITAGGKNISPSEIENSLKTSPFIKEAIVIGDRRKFISALVGIDDEVVGNWAQARKIPYTTYRDLSERPEVVELVAGEVAATNEKFARVEQVKEFRLLPKLLDHDDGEVTATQKVKRSAIGESFADLIEDMYDGSPREDRGSTS
jgi:long-chain acyl-CoA synthetase